MKVEEQFLVNGKMHKFEDTGPYNSGVSPSISPTKLQIEEQRKYDHKQKKQAINS